MQSQLVGNYSEKLCLSFFPLICYLRQLWHDKRAWKGLEQQINVTDTKHLKLSFSVMIATLVHPLNFIYDGLQAKSNLEDVYLLTHFQKCHFRKCHSWKYQNDPSNHFWENLKMTLLKVSFLKVSKLLFPIFFIDVIWTQIPIYFY